VCVNFTQSVTAFGRMMIELTKKHVEEMFTISNGYEHDALVSLSVSLSICLY